MTSDQEFESILPPQLSLSTPELGLETPVAPTMRRCVSSTELLYEKAMQRFYAAVQLEESEKNNRRSESIDPYGHHDLPSSRKRLSSFGESDALERRNSIKRKFSTEKINLPQKALDNKEQTNKLVKKDIEQDEIVDEPHIDEAEEIEEEIRDLKKEILDSQRKLSLGKRHSPSSSIEFEEDYTDSTASSASMSSLDSMEKFKNVIHSISIEKQDELDTYNPMMSSRTVSSSNIRTIDDDVIESSRMLLNETLLEKKAASATFIANEQQVSKESKEEEDEEENRVSDEEHIEDNTYQQEARALSPYRTPDADQSSIALTKPLPMPSPDFVPKPILKRPSTETDTKEKKTKQKTKTKKTERKSLLQLFKKTPSTGNLNTPAEKSAPTESTSKMSAAALAKKKSMEQRQSSFEENKVAIDHYSDIVKELSTSRRPKVPIYMSTEELKKAAEKEASEHNLSQQSAASSQSSIADRILRPPASPQPPKQVEPILRPVIKLKESDSRSIFAIKLSKDPKKMNEMKLETKPAVVEVEDEPDEILYQPYNSISPPPVPEPEHTRGRSKEATGAIPKKRAASGTRSRSNSALRSKTVKEAPSAVKQRAPSKTRMKSQSKSPSGKRAPFHVARIGIRDGTERSPALTPEPRSQTPEQLLDEAEKKVKSTMVYVTDVTMLIVACWVYMFKDARLVLPILALMIYRQAGSALKNKIPKWMKRKSDASQPEEE